LSRRTSKSSFAFRGRFVKTTPLLKSSIALHRQRIATVQDSLRIAQVVQWCATGCMARVRFLAVQDLRTNSMGHLASYPMGTAGSFPEDPRINSQVHEADHWPLSSAEVKKGGAIHPLPHVFMA
jgi:hypothetical protein